MKQFICDSCECAKKHGPCILAVPPTEGDDVPVNCPYLDPNSKPDWRDHHPQPIDVLADATFKAKPDNTLTLHHKFEACPCCGGKPDFYIGTEFESGRGMVYCKNCLLKMDALELSDLSERWNKRVTLG